MQIIFKLSYEALKLAKSPAAEVDSMALEPLQTPHFYGTFAILLKYFKEYFQFQLESSCREFYADSNKHCDFLCK